MTDPSNRSKFLHPQSRRKETETPREAADKIPRSRHTNKYNTCKVALKPVTGVIYNPYKVELWAPEPKKTRLCSIKSSSTQNAWWLEAKRLIIKIPRCAECMESLPTCGLNLWQI